MRRKPFDASLLNQKITQTRDPFFPSPSYPFCSKQHNKYEGCFLVKEGHKEGGF